MTGHMTPTLEALYSARANEALASKLDLYGRFVGSWRLDVNFHPLQGAVERIEGELHFSWVLDGRAVQDVWIYPARHLRADRPAKFWHAYGTTFRWYDPAIDAWHIAWFDPTRALEMRQIGRAVGADIVQLGEDHNGLLNRWRFVEITDRSFTWLGERSWDKGSTWTLLMEMHASRIA
jgi:hypothetical protein